MSRPIGVVLALVTSATLLPFLVERVAAAGHAACTGSIGAQRFENLEVPPDATCMLTGTQVDGNITVGANATLVANDVTVGGNVQAVSASAITLRAGSTVGGSVQIKQGGSATVDSTQVTGDIQLEANRSALSVTQNKVGGNVQVFQNQGGATITDNRIDGNLQCKENTPAPVGGRNQAASFEDQCAGFAGTPAQPTPAPTLPPATPTPTPTPTATPQPMPPSGDGCRGIIGAQRFENLEVPANASCTLNGTRVDGNITVGTNATLHALGVIVGGNIQAEGAADVVVNNNATVGGSVQIKQGGSATVDQVQVTGDIQLESNRGALGATRNQVGGNVQVFQNRGGATIADNRIDGNLQCKANTPAPVGGRNQAASFEDQCAGFAGEPAQPPAPAPGPDGVICQGSLGAQAYTNVIVPDGAACTMSGTRVTGNVSVGSDATLQAGALVVSGNVQATGAAAVALTNNSSIGGSVRIVQGGSATVDQVVVKGDLQLEANQRALSATRNRVGGSLKAIGNQAGVVVRSNTVDGAVQCRQNLFLPLADDNLAASLDEQCASLATRMFLPAIAVRQ